MNIFFFIKVLIQKQYFGDVTLSTCWTMMPGHDVMHCEMHILLIMWYVNVVMWSIMFCGFSLDVLLLCHIDRASQSMTELSVLVQEMASMMPIFFKSKMQIKSFNLHMGMFEVVLELVTDVTFFFIVYIIWIFKKPYDTNRDQWVNISIPTFGNRCTGMLLTVSSHCPRQYLITS